jgi:hypothetical protein
MRRVEHANGVATYVFDSLAGLPVRAHVATRHGGASPEPWASLNFSAARGDTPERVAENRRRLGEALGLDARRFTFCQQVHGTGIAKVDAADAGVRQEGCDGLVTDTRGLPLALVFADCVPVLLYDRARRALGVVHAGWRGTVNGGATAALWALQAAFGTEPEDVAACIGPSIGPSSYEVGPEVWEMAQARLAGAGRFFAWPNGPERNPHFDLWQANAQQLIDAGVLPDHVEIAGIDTAQHTGDFFSHRAERSKCGLFAMVAWLEG